MTIRRQPEDFVVAERLSGAFRWQLREKPPASGAAHAVYELEKTSLTTPDAVSALAKALGVRPGEVDYAGLKDKHAKTKQHVSVPLAEAPEVGSRAVPPSDLSGRQWSARLAGFSTSPMTAASIDGNAFTIVVRDLSATSAQEMLDAAMLLCDGDPGTIERSDAATLVMTNYFGDQRFGSARHGEGFAARHLVMGDFDAALRLLIATPSRKDAGKTREFRRIAAQHWGDWKGLASRLPRCAERGPIERLAAGASEREAFAAMPAFIQMICVEAYQSHLWNAIAHRLVGRIIREASERDGASDADERPYIEADDPFGAMAFASARDVGEEWRTLDLPLLAPKTELVEPWRAEAQETLAEEDLTIDQLRIPGLRRPYFGEAPRRLMVEATRFTLTGPEKDDLANRPGRLKRTASFDLPKGSYATVLLRALGQ